MDHLPEVAFSENIVFFNAQGCEGGGGGGPLTILGSKGCVEKYLVL